MPCYHPIYMYRSKAGPNSNGKVPIVSYKDRNRGKQLSLPCGRCIGCRLERSRQWAVRCMGESQMHEHNQFLTLTYKEEELVYGAAEHGILYPRHLTLFFKRLRKHAGPGLRYFACGEYGERYNRPHYHAIVFGLDVKDREVKPSKGSNKLYRSDSLDAIWTHGDVTIGDVSFESCAYVARYVMKKRMGNTADTYEEEGISPEFVVMSRMPPKGSPPGTPGGIGASWLAAFQSDVYPRGDILVNGKLCKPPKYYDSIYERLEPTKMQAIREERMRVAEEAWEDSEPKRLRVRENVKIAAISSLTRKLD